MLSFYQRWIQRRVLAKMKNKNIVFYHSSSCWLCVGVITNFLSPQRENDKWETCRRRLLSKKPCHLLKDMCGFIYQVHHAVHLNSSLMVAVAFLLSAWWNKVRVKGTICWLGNSSQAGRRLSEEMQKKPTIYCNSRCNKRNHLFTCMDLNFSLKWCKKFFHLHE